LCLIGGAEALSRVILGARNSLDPDLKFDQNEKYNKILEIKYKYTGRSHIKIFSYFYAPIIYFSKLSHLSLLFQTSPFHISC
jgi:hypothetical protein